MERKFFEIVPSGTQINFIGKSRFVFIFSALLIVGALVLLSIKGLNYGVDFTGGTQIHLRFQEKLASADLRDALKPVGLSDVLVQGFGEKDSGEFLIRVQPQDLNIQAYEAKLQKALNSVNEEKVGSAKIRFSEERVYVTYPREVFPKKIEEAIQKLSIQDLKVESVAPFGPMTSHEYLIQFAGVARRIVDAFREKFGSGRFEVLQIEQVGAKVGSELRRQAIGAVLISIILILVYVWFRFDMEYAPGAIVALIHDALVVLGVFSIFRLQFDLSTVAAVLTIVGLSINDTIVIYDRIRENIKKTNDFQFPELINQSINETLSRTILTSGTGLFAALALLLLGGPITFNFALAFTIGIISGTYSTIYVASPLTIYFHNYLQRKRIRR